ncbi:MAG: hypothetical protein ISR77_14305, partial [Pirellulaceae bacterium]|nr:hypothetical protein [Pirellulaceae bacterium]
MSRREYLLLAVSPLLMLLLAAGTPAAPPVDNAGSAVLSTYDSSSGETYFALSLTPTVTPKRASAHDVLVLFDTSASQTGAYRDDALDGLRTMLTSLAPEDRVKLMAIDLNAIAMTDGFVAPGSEAMTAGLSKLGKRVPLGSTDMRAALKGATTSFSGDAANPRSVIYIGDGMSRANLLETGEFASLVDKLVSSRVSVSSFAIGPGRDVHMLAALANHTGGMVYLDAAEGRSSDRAGLAMADVVRATVYWPVSAKLPADMQDALPQRMPPLRSDRDTVLLGSLGSRRTQQVAVTAEANGRPVEMLWNVAAEPSNDDYSFLPQMVATARDNGGIGLPTVGSAGLRLVASLVADNNEALAKLGATALRNGDNNGAMKVANAVLKRDPNNPQALVIRDAIERRGGSARANDEPELRLVALQDPDAAAPAQPGGGLLAELGDEGAFLNSVQNTEEVMRQKIQAEVEEELSDARDRLGSNPQGAKNDLKLLQETVENSTDLDPDSRAQLLDQVQSAIREAGRRAYEEESRRALAEENRAASEDRQQLVKELAEKRQKIKQMMVKFNSMMDEGRYRDAEDIIAENVRELDPLGTTPVTATWAARFGGHVSTLVRLREVRHKNFALTLLEVEKSLIPFPGDPPILYPEPQVWADLTLRRKKYASIDLARTGGAEAKILEALDDDTRLEFIETPLDQVVDFLKDQHGINIELDAGELDNVGIGTDVPITRNLKGITLRSALRLMLKDLELTYVIRDEVLLITTP